MATILPTLRNAESAQHYLLDFGRCRGYGVIEGLFQPLDSIGGMLHFVHVIQERGLQRRLRKAHLALHPIHVFAGPVSLDVFRRPAAVAPRKLPQAVTSSELILASVFAGAD